MEIHQHNRYPPTCRGHPPPEAPSQLPNLSAIGQLIGVNRPMSVATHGPDYLHRDDTQPHHHNVQRTTKQLATPRPSCRRRLSG